MDNMTFTKTANCPNGHADPIYVDDATAECHVCGLRYDADTGAELGEPNAKTIAAARKEFAAARTKHRNLRLGRYEGRNNGGDSTYNITRATALARECGRELEGLLWAEHRDSERISENRDAGQDRPELRAKVAGYRARIRALTV